MEPLIRGSAIGDLLPEFNKYIEYQPFADSKAISSSKADHGNPGTCANLLLVRVNSPGLARLAGRLKSLVELG